VSITDGAKHRFTSMNATSRGRFFFSPKSSGMSGTRSSLSLRLMTSMAAMRHGVAVEGWCKSPAMPHDLVIRGGTIIDGTGRPGAMGDVAIDGDRLTQVGGRAGVARREINAGGLAVTPGVVDPHTHYDAQICWDQALTPSCWHGVTSVVMGNCGFTIAPCPPHGRARLMRMLERVEGMSLAALEAGITWEWETFP